MIYVKILLDNADFTFQYESAFKVGVGQSNSAISWASFRARYKIIDNFEETIDECLCEDVRQKSCCKPF